MKPKCEICGSDRHFSQLGSECKILIERDAALLHVERLKAMLNGVRGLVFQTAFNPGIHELEGQILRIIEGPADDCPMSNLCDYSESGSLIVCNKPMPCPDHSSSKEAEKRVELQGATPTEAEMKEIADRIGGSTLILPASEKRVCRCGAEHTGPCLPGAIS